MKGRKREIVTVVMAGLSVCVFRCGWFCVPGELP